MKKVISLLIVSTFIFGARNIDNLMYIKPGMDMQEVHKLIEKPHNVRATKINEQGKVTSIHEYHLKKLSKTRNSIILTSIVSGFIGWSSVWVDDRYNYSRKEKIYIPIGSALLGALYAILRDISINKETFWFFYEDDRLVFFCKPGDWETTAPPTLRVQWQDLN